MNKSDLIDLIANSAEISKAAAGRALDSMLDGITNALSKGDIVTLIGFGTFAVRKRAARMGRNPKTGEPINIKEAKVPGFKAGTNLKQMVQSA